MQQTPDVYSTPLGGGVAAGPSMISYNQQMQQTQVANFISRWTLYLLPCRVLVTVTPHQLDKVGL